MERKLSAIELMINGYAKSEKEKHNDLTDNEAEKQGDVTDFMGRKLERELTPVEKIMLGYNEDGLQKNKETSIDLNDIKKEEGK